MLVLVIDFLRSPQSVVHILAPLLVLRPLHTYVHTYTSFPPDHPYPPTLREAVTTTTFTATFKVDHRKTCFQECTFHYELRVHPADSPTLTSTSNHSTGVLSVSGLTGDTMYRAEVVAVCVGESTIRSDPLTVTFTTMEGELSVCL